MPATAGLPHASPLDPPACSLVPPPFHGAGVSSEVALMHGREVAGAEAAAAQLIAEANAQVALALRVT